MSLVHHTGQVARNVILGACAVKRPPRRSCEEPDAKLTIVQFDGEEPHEVLVEAIPLAEAMPFTQADFVPRGMTPLFDATVLTVTDGQENASHEFDLAAVRRQIEAKTEAGWTFTFLSAAVDAYADARTMGYDERSVQGFAPDGPGTGHAFRSLSGATSQHRRDRRAGQVDKRDFFKGDKQAEQDRKRRQAS